MSNCPPEETFLHPSRIELSRAALKNNLRFLRALAQKGVRISSVIKGNAYGHGIAEFLPLAENAGIDHFSVFSADEASAALSHKKNDETSVMILGMIRDSEMEWAIQNEVEFYLFEPGRMKAAAKSARQLGKKAKVHIQLETGMNREGFSEEEWENTFKYIENRPDLFECRGICTHLAGAETIANYYRINQQKEKFENGMELARSCFTQRPLFHVSSSASFLTRSDLQYDMVRIGIAQYGFWPSRETYMNYLKSRGLGAGEDPLQRVLTWKSEVMSVKTVQEGEFIGYGTSYLAGKEMTIAMVPVGYAHGFGRNLTNTGFVLVKGMRAGVTGVVNMNMITINVTDIEGVKKGDDVILIGEQEEDVITVASFGEMMNGLNYEVLVRIPESIPRIVY